MKKILFAMVFAALALLCASGAQAQVKVIANKSIAKTQISSRQVMDIFMLEKDSLEGSQVQPVLQKDGQVHDAFLSQYVHLKAAALQSYYKTMLFSGKAAMPRSFGSDAEVVDYVAKTKGAIGYVSASAATNDVATLEVR
jgi:hypothetical protein